MRGYSPQVVLFSAIKFVHFSLQLRYVPSLTLWGRLSWCGGRSRGSIFGEDVADSSHCARNFSRDLLIGANQLQDPLTDFAVECLCLRLTAGSFRERVPRKPVGDR